MAWLINLRACATRRRTVERRKEKQEDILFTDLSEFRRLLCSCHIAKSVFGAGKREKKERKKPPQDMIMIQLIFMMAVDWVPLKIREQSMALKVNHEIDFFNMSRIRLNIDIHFRSASSSSTSLLRMLVSMQRNTPRLSPSYRKLATQSNQIQNLTITPTGGYWMR